jgi:cytochrome c553
VTTYYKLAVLLLLASGASAQKNWDAPSIVTTYCSGCHGVDGNTQLPYFPKLAGLQADYAEKKLTAFQEPAVPPVDELFSWIKQRPKNLTHDERTNMEGASHAASPAIIKQAVIWYSRQPPVKGHSSDSQLMEQGEKLFMKGMPSEKIVPCMSCHGAVAEGKGTAPRLAGQNAEYIQNQLQKFRAGDRKHAPEMTLVTRDLDVTQARAAALYLQSK